MEPKTNGHGSAAGSVSDPEQEIDGKGAPVFAARLPELQDDILRFVDVLDNLDS